MNGNTHSMRRPLQLPLVAAAAIVVAAVLAGGGSGATKLATPSPRDGRGCADFGLVFYIDGCVSRPTARARAAAYDGDFMFRDFTRGTNWQRRGA